MCAACQPRPSACTPVLLHRRELVSVWPCRSLPSDQLFPKLRGCLLLRLSFSLISSLSSSLGCPGRARLAERVGARAPGHSARSAAWALPARSTHGVRPFKTHGRLPRLSRCAWTACNSSWNPGPGVDRASCLPWRIMRPRFPGTQGLNFTGAARERSRPASASACSSPQTTATNPCIVRAAALEKPQTLQILIIEPDGFLRLRGLPQR